MSAVQQEQLARMVADREAELERERLRERERRAEREREIERERQRERELERERLAEIERERIKREREAREAKEAADRAQREREAKERERREQEARVRARSVSIPPSVPVDGVCADTPLSCVGLCRSDSGKSNWSDRSSANSNSNESGTNTATDVRRAGGFCDRVSDLPRATSVPPVLSCVLCVVSCCVVT
jgi:hypothetical protein